MHHLIGRRIAALESRQRLEHDVRESLGRVVAVFAHMDDEITSGGLLRQLGACGQSRAIIVLTDGRANPKTDPGVVGGRDHFEVRREELSEAAALLQIPQVLAEGRFHDFNLKSYHDEAAGYLRRQLESLRPDTIVTFEPSGTNYHPDHVATHHIVRAALVSLKADTRLLMLTPPGLARLIFGSRQRQPAKLLELACGAPENQVKCKLVDIYRSQRPTTNQFLLGMQPETFFGRVITKEWYYLCGWQ
ncbi:MAG: hypothetical protein A2289_20035 [Deltaproteobacteria bacterium RIFOXYA12_FULL_58_15]|nr:MAG: hypothetical protein A2289_20035 [Deltaproteobacteria bacterium RIFOXYA12_FULL_58_15]OGR07142.1 MAG: hypothetical protein A2341_03330 [Deltaproteobacteria bacterium RIFOXYB12_FULL_58_9]